MRLETRSAASQETEGEVAMGSAPIRKRSIVPAGSADRAALNTNRTLSQRKKERLERGDLAVDVEMRYQQELYDEGYGLSFDID